MSDPAFGQRDLRSVHGAAPILKLLVENHFNRASTARRPDKPPADAINLTLTRMTDGLLTPREIEITSLILRGHSTMSIAERLGIVEGTVKIHRKNIYHKLGIASQAELFGTFIPTVHIACLFAYGVMPVARLSLVRSWRGNSPSHEQNWNGEPGICQKISRRRGGRRHLSERRKSFIFHAICAQTVL